MSKFDEGDLFCLLQFLPKSSLSRWRADESCNTALEAVYEFFLQIYTEAGRPFGDSIKGQLMWLREQKELEEFFEDNSNFFGSC